MVILANLSVSFLIWASIMGTVQVAIFPSCKDLKFLLISPVSFIILRRLFKPINSCSTGASLNLYCLICFIKGPYTFSVVTLAASSTNWLGCFPLILALTISLEKSDIDIASLFKVFLKLIPISVLGFVWPMLSKYFI